MEEFKFRHKEETWLILTIKAYDYNLAVINIEKCGINIQDYDYIKPKNWAYLLLSESD